jgi:hypothetical protein
MTESSKAVVAALWSSLAAREWVAVGGLIAEDCIYYDAPIGSAAAAGGPQDLLARLRMALELWADYGDYRTLMDAAPSGWQDSMAGADISWMCDATGQV